MLVWQIGPQRPDFGTMRNLNDLYYFAQVVEHQGFSRAARALGLPKSTLSRRIASLEDDLGARLINRSSRQFSVTEIGTTYHQHCVAMLVEAEAAQAVIDNITSEPRGVVRVACPTGLLSYQIGSLITAFMSENPKVHVHLESTNRHVDVVGEGFDLAIRVREQLEASELVMRKLGESVHRLVASSELLGLRGLPKSPADLSTWPTLDFAPARADHIWNLNHPEGMSASVRHHPRLVTDDTSMLHDAAIQGVGVALLPAVVVAKQLRDGRLIDLLPQWRPERWTIHAVFPSRRGLLPAVRLLIDHLAAGAAAST